MAVTYESVATTSYASTASLVITKPTGLAVGDLMVAQCVLLDASETFTTPSGWTVAGSAQRANTTYQTIFYKIADSADVAASDFTFSLGSAKNCAGGLLRISGANQTQPIDAIDSDTAIDSASPTFLGGITPTYTNELLIFFNSNAVGRTTSSQAIATSNPSWTERYDINNLGGIACATATRSQTTATGDYSCTLDSGTGIEDSAAHLVAIKDIVSVTVSPSVINATGAVPTPTISGGATVSPSVINATGAVLAPAHTDQADWSAKGKSSSGTWNSQTKS